MATSRKPARKAPAKPAAKKPATRGKAPAGKKKPAARKRPAKRRAPRKKKPVLTPMTRESLAALPDADAVQLARWHRQHRGLNNFLPHAIRRMPLETQLALAKSPALTAAWIEREQERCAASPLYFAENYGSVDPPKGAAIPFVLWPSQRELLEEIRDHDKLWILKARRLGLTWLVLHYGLWLISFDPENFGARVLVFCKNRGDAGKLLDRVKAIHDRLPVWLRKETGRDSVTALEIPSREAEIVALAATEGAARQETATLVVLDEFAFAKNGMARRIWTAIQPTIEGGGQLVGISTGNGTTGDGETFATVWEKALARENGVVPLFLSWQARPDRTEKWREAQRADYLSDEDFLAEYPETPDDALAGEATVKVYSHAGLAAAIRHGEQLRAKLPELLPQGYEWGIDWGDFQTFAVYALPLPGGGIYVVDEKVLAHTEPSAAASQIILHRPACHPELDPDGEPADPPRFTASRADSAPAGTNRTFKKVLDEIRREQPGRMPESHLRVPFSQFKEGGGEKKGVNTVGYLRMLVNAAERVPDSWTEISELTGTLAIDPRCETLIRQLRALERDPKTGKVKKPTMNPKDPTKGDHGPDSLVALAAPRAAEWTKTALSHRSAAEV